MRYLSLDDIDARIAALGAEVDHMGSSLTELDSDVTLKLLASATLSGRTAREWSAAAAQIPMLWAYYGALKDKLSEITGLRGTRPRLKADQLEALGTALLGDSVVLPADPAAPPGRSLTTTVRTTSIAWLQSAMKPMFQQVVSVVDRVGAAWSALPRLETMDAELTGLVQTAAQAGIKPPAEVAAVRAQVAGLREAVRADPLSAEVAQVASLSGQVQAAQELVRAALAARDGLTARLASAAQTLTDTAGLIEQSQTVGDEAAQKILGVGQVASQAQELAARLARLRSNLENITSAARSNWQEAARLLGQLEQQAASLRADARTALGSVRDPMEQRNELRGRLDAYHAKAQAVGRAEDEALTRLYQRAQDLLFTAPCDVAAAEAALRSYQQELSRPAHLAG